MSTPSSSHLTQAMLSSRAINRGRNGEQRRWLRRGVRSTVRSMLRRGMELEVMTQLLAWLKDDVAADGFGEAGKRDQANV
jgi:hypothetical protein